MFSRGKTIFGLLFEGITVLTLQMSSQVVSASGGGQAVRGVALAEPQYRRRGEHHTGTHVVMVARE